MAFFDEIGKTLADKSREAAKKAKDVAEILQLKAQISTEKSKTKELYASIGVLYFKKHRDNENERYCLSEASGAGVSNHPVCIHRDHQSDCHTGTSKGNRIFFQ